jgi:hypothetical protein
LTDHITYNIPVSLMDAYREKKTIIRTNSPSEISHIFSDSDPERLSYIRILYLDGTIDDFKNWVPGIPIDLVVRDPLKDLPLLYCYAPLLSAHPIRVSIPLVHGFDAVVKLAASLNFSVKVEGGQPDQALTGEMLRIANYYLHRTTVTEPIEFFHSLFLAFYRGNPLTLWAIQEEDPEFVRYVSDGGVETMAGRFAGVEIPSNFSLFVRRFTIELASEQDECTGCDFLLNCQGYFKWPRRDYRCDGVKTFMRALRDAAVELREDVASFQAGYEGEQS